MYVKLSARRQLTDGLWTNDIVFGQLLALCPVLAVTTTAINGLGMGLASMFVLVVANFSVSALRRIILRQLRIPMFVLVIASIVTIVDLCMNAMLHDLHKVLGLFIPLIVTNCAVLGRAESFASRYGVVGSTIDGFTMGLGFTVSLTIIGGVREVIGSGTLFSGASLLFGEQAKILELTLLPGYRGFLVGLLPAGGFFIVGGLLALKRLINQRATTKSASACGDCSDTTCAGER